MTLKCGTPPDLKTRVQTVNCRSVAEQRWWWWWWWGGWAGLSVQECAGGCKACVCACVKAKGYVAFDP